MITVRHAAVALPLALLAFTACGGGDSGDGDGVASLDDPTVADTAGDDPAGDESGDDPAGGSTPPSTEPVDAEAQWLEFAACMRENGVDMPDPEFTDDGGVSVAIGSGPNEGDGPDMETVDAAHAACEDLMPDAPITRDGEGVDRAKMQDEMLEFTQCMRDEGIEIDDPNFDEGGRIMVTATVPDGGDAPRGPTMSGPFGTLDLSDPDTADAFDKCSEGTVFGGGGALPAGAGARDGDE